MPCESTSTLLCVDDERGVLHALRRLLRKQPYALLTAESGEEALALLAEQDVQVVLSDYRMPGLNGTAFLRAVKTKHPDAVRAMLSGYADLPVVLEAINQCEIYRFLPKPWHEGELKAMLRACFAHYEQRRQQRLLIEQMQRQAAALQQRNEHLEHFITRLKRTPSCPY